MAIYGTSESLEWLNGNMHRNYPIVDNTVAKSITGDYLPSSFLLDLQLVVPFVEGLDNSRFFISSIVRNASSFQVTIGYMISSPTDDYRQGFDCAISGAIPLGLEYTGSAFDREHSITLTAITAVPSNTAASYTYGIPAGYEALKDIRGSIYIGSCVDMTNISAMQFNWEATAITPMCVFVESRETQVQSVRFIDDNGITNTLTDDFTIRLGEGIVATVSDDKSHVTFAVSSDYVQEKLAEALRGKVGAAIKTINGQGPDANGNFQIVGLDCTLISQDQGSSSIRIDNPCAKPCCDQGGEDSAEVLSALTELSQAKDVLNAYYTDLATKINSMQARLSSLIASRK